MAVKKLDNNTYSTLVHEKYRDQLQWDKITVKADIKPSEMLELVLNEGMQHIMCASHPHLERELNISALMTTNPEGFAKDPLNSIFNPTQEPATAGNPTILCTDFCRASDKAALLASLEECLVSNKASSSLRSDVLIIADEVITNAIYNAPFVNRENNNGGASRTDQSISLPPGKEANLLLGVSEDQVVVGVRDPFGSLNPTKLIQRIKNCYDTSVADNMNFTSNGGAGIGSYMVFNSSASYYLLVAEGEYTMVCASLPLKMSSRARQELPKNIHLKIKGKE